HCPSGKGGQLATKAFGGCMRAVRNRESIVDPQIAKLCKRTDKVRIVFFFAGVKARVLEAKNVAGLHRFNGAFRHLAAAIIRKSNGALDDAGYLGGDRLK